MQTATQWSSSNARPGLFGAAPREVVMPRQQTAHWLLVLLLLLGLSLWAYDSFQVGAFMDDAQYVVLAESIAHGPIYGTVNQPGTPGPTPFPFGFPLVLAAFTWLPNPLWAMKLVSLFATLLNVTILFWGWPLFVQGRPYWLRLATVSLLAASPLVVGNTRTVMSEPVFLTWLLLSLVLAAQSAAHPRSILYPVGLGMSLTLMIFTRTIGVAPAAGVALVIVAQRGLSAWKPLSISAAGALVLLATVIGLTPVRWQDIVPHEYVSDLVNPANVPQAEPSSSAAAHAGETAPAAPPNRSIRGLLTTFSARASWAATQFVEHTRGILIPVGGGEREAAVLSRAGLGFLPGALAIGILGLVIWGGALLVATRSLSPFAAASLLGYLGVLSVWAWDSPRLLYPVQPFLTVCFLVGGYTALRLAGRLLRPGKPHVLWPQAAVIGVAALLVLASALKSLTIVDSGVAAGDVTAGAAWLRQQTPADAVVAARYPATVYLYAGRKTLEYPSDGGPAELRRFVADQDVDYILVTPEFAWRNVDRVRVYDAYTAHTLLPLLQRGVADGEFALVYTDPQQAMTQVYARR